MTPARRRLAASHPGHDAPHARRDATCKTCHEHRTFYAFVAPDPQGAAERRVDLEAFHWMATHPCIALYAHPRAVRRAAA